MPDLDSILAALPAPPAPAKTSVLVVIPKHDARALNIHHIDTRVNLLGKREWAFHYMDGTVRVTHDAAQAEQLARDAFLVGERPNR